MGIERESIADRFVIVMNRVREIDEGVDNDNPHRYPIRCMRRAAEKIISDALAAALDVSEAARVLRDEIHAMDARNQP